MTIDGLKFTTTPTGIVKKTFLLDHGHTKLSTEKQADSVETEKWSREGQLLVRQITLSYRNSSGDFQQDKGALVYKYQRIGP